jgi:hypothetical protein
MLSITYVMVRSPEGASRTTHGGRAAPGSRFEINSFTRSCAAKTEKSVSGELKVCDRWPDAARAVSAWVADVAVAQVAAAGAVFEVVGLQFGEVVGLR